MGDRFDVKSLANCAHKIWRELLVAPGEENGDAFEKRKLSLTRADFVQSGSAGNVDHARPTDRFIVLAIKQLMMQPEQFGEGRDAPPKMLAPQYGQQVFEKLQAQGADKAHLQPQYINAFIQPAPKLPKWIEFAEKIYQSNALEIRRAMVEVVNHWRAGAPPLRVADVFEAPDVMGPDAILRLRARLLDGVVADGADPGEGGIVIDDELDCKDWLDDPDSFGGTPFHFEVAGPEDPRTPMLLQIRKAVFDPNSPYRLINGYVSGMPGALTALSADLFSHAHREFYKCGSPILYVPLHGRGLAPPRDSYAEMVYAIWRFYRKIRLRSGAIAPLPEGETSEDARPFADRDLREPRTLDETVEMIRAIQWLMAEHPAIIIFDGYRAGRFKSETRDYSLHNLIAAIAGDRLFDLIERLTMIPTPESAGPIDVTTFLRNRFVVFSDNELYENAGGSGEFIPRHPHPALRLIKGASIPINAPQKQFLERILPSFGHQAPKQIAWIREHIGRVDAIDEGELQAAFGAHVEQILSLCDGPLLKQVSVSENVTGVLSTLLKLGGGSTKRLSDISPHAALRGLIEQDLLPRLNRLHPDWLQFFHLIAIAPGGLRPKTLARVFAHLREMQNPDEEPDRAAINAQIAEMLEACHGIIGVCRSDHLEALRGRPLPLLFRNGFSLDKYEIPTDRAIEFRSDEVRLIVLRNVEASADRRYLPFLHLLLAEEAYEQSTHIARYDDLQSEDSLHRRSRLLTALFHGAASLGSSDLDVEPLYHGAGRFLPDDPSERWIKLFTFAYRKNLDWRPLHLLVRNYDASQTKLDILLALARPQLCRKPERPQEVWKLPRIKRPDWTLDAEEKAREREREEKGAPWGLLGEFALELRGAARAVSRNLSFDWAAAGLTGESDQEFVADIGEKILQLTDADQYEEAPGTAIPQQILDRIHDLLGNKQTPRYLAMVAHQVRWLLRGSRRDQLISGVFSRKLAIMAAVPQKKRKRLADYLNLYGEVLGLKAERDYGLAIATNGDTDPSEAVREGFVQSFAAFYIAEYLRRELIFWSAPDSTAYVTNGHAARGYIRVAMKLERFRATVLRQKNIPSAPGSWFWKNAHDVADELARHLSRFPRERVAMLTLDATLARYYESRNSPHYAQYLTMARECLSSAEPLLLKLGLHNRMRHRFALERSKVLAESAKLASRQGDIETARRYLAICEIDIAAFDELATEGNLLWKNLADSHRDKLGKLRAEIGAVSEV